MKPKVDVMLDLVLSALDAEIGRMETRAYLDTAYRQGLASRGTWRAARNAETKAIKKASARIDELCAALEGKNQVS